jgi:hypothetical protein
MDRFAGDEAAEGGGLTPETQPADGRRSRFLPDKAQLGWVIGWCLLAITAFYIADNPFIHVLLLLPFGATAIGLLISGLWRAWELRGAPVASTATALLLPCAVFAWPYFGSVATYVEFLQNRPHYDRIVAEASRLGEGGTCMGTDYLVDRRGDAIRIAFVTSPGVVDNWGGIVYDPTDAVASARGHDTAPAAVRELFGGDIVSCRRLTGHYYSCGFT